MLAEKSESGSPVIMKLQGKAAGFFNTHHYLEKVTLFSISKRPLCFTECQALLLQSSSPFKSLPSHIRECERVCFQAQTRDPSIKFIIS